MVSPAPDSSRTPENDAAPSSSAASAAASKPAVELTAVTTRDDFLLELGEALAGQASVRPVETMAAALEHLASARRAQVLVLDSRDLNDLRAELDRIEAQSAETPVLVFAPHESEKEVATALKGGHVFAVLPIPLDARKTAALIEGAIAEAVARKGPVERPAAGTEPSRGFRGLTGQTGTHSLPSGNESLTGSPGAARFVSSAGAQSRASSAGSSGSGSEWPSRKVLIGAAVGVAVVALGAVYFLRPHAMEPAPVLPAASALKSAAAALAPSAPAPTETLLLKGKVDDLLERGRLAMRERRYSEPAGDNALLYYRSAAAADASNGEAADGLQRVAGVLANRFDDAVGAGRLDEASQALSNFKLALPDDPRANSFEVRLLSAWISKAFADGNFDRAALLIRQAAQSSAISADQVAKWRIELARHQEDIKVQRLANLITDRLRDGRLSDPADDSARSYMKQLHEAAPTNAVTQRLEKELGAAYLRRAREAALANHPQDLERWLNEARTSGVTAAEVSALQREVSGTRSRAVAAESDRLEKLVRERLHDGHLADPAQDSAVVYLAQLQSNDPNNTAAGALSHELAARFIERARGEAQNNQAAAVDADLTQAKRWGADAKDIQAVQTLQTANASSAASRQVSPAKLAATLKKTRNVSPEYPPRALADKIAGAVTVEFTVTTSGEPRDIRVVESTPPGVFDRSALNAVRRWHWESPPVEIPMRTAIRFELPK